MRLGEKTYTCVPQRKAYLRKRLSKALNIDTELLDTEAGVDGVLRLIDTQAYKLLRVFVPNLMPEWEFEGFPTKEAWENDDYNESYDHSPTVPQVKTAIAELVELNGLDLIKHLKNFISPDFLRALMTSSLANLMTGTSATSSATSTDTPSTSSGTTDPTSAVLTVQEPTSASPSPDSSPSSEPTGVAEPASATS